jgi:hypothetical protein
MRCFGVRTERMRGSCPTAGLVLLGAIGVALAQTDGAPKEPGLPVVELTPQEMNVWEHNGAGVADRRRRSSGSR